MTDYTIIYSGGGSTNIRAEDVEETSEAVYFFSENSPENSNAYAGDAVAVFRKDDIASFYDQAALA